MSRVSKETSLTGGTDTGEQEAWRVLDKQKEAAVQAHHLLLLSGLYHPGDPECDECKLLGEPYPEVKEDYANGMYVCTGCGLHVGPPIISTETEWRTMNDDAAGSGNKVDPNRVGGPETLHDQLHGLSTRIEGNSALSMVQEKTTASPMQRRIETGSLGIRKLAQRIDCSERIVTLATQLFIDVTKEQFARKTLGRIKFPRTRSSLYIACLIQAYRRLGIAFTMTQFDGVSDATNKQIRSAWRTLSRLKMEIGPQSAYGTADTTRSSGSGNNAYVSQAESLINVYCNKLKLSFQSVKLAESLAEKAIRHPGVRGKKPSTVAGACIKMIAPHLSYQDIHAVCGISAKTIESTVRGLRPLSPPGGGVPPP